MAMIYPPIVSKETLAIIAKELEIYSYMDLDASCRKYIYSIYDPRITELNMWYVGCTQYLEHRISQHFTRATNEQLRIRIDDLKSNNIKPVYNTICECNIIRDAIIAEVSWIRYFGELGHPMCNIQVGGLGFTKYDGTHCNLGRTHIISDETRARMSEAKRGNSYGLGYKHTDKARSNMSEAGLGRRHTDKSKSNMSEAQLGKKRSPESIRKRQLTCHNKHASKEGFSPSDYVNFHRHCIFCISLLGLNKDTVMVYIESKRKRH